MPSSYNRWLEDEGTLDNLRHTVLIKAQSQSFKVWQPVLLLLDNMSLCDVSWYLRLCANLSPENEFTFEWTYLITCRHAWWVTLNCVEPVDLSLCNGCCHWCVKPSSSTSHSTSDCQTSSLLQVFPLILALLATGQSDTELNSCFVLCPPGKSQHGTVCYLVLSSNSEIITTHILPPFSTVSKDIIKLVHVMIQMQSTDVENVSITHSQK